MHKKQTVEIHPNMAEVHHKKSMELQSPLTDEATLAQAVDLIRSMIERCTQDRNAANRQSSSGGFGADPRLHPE